MSGGLLAFEMEASRLRAQTAANDCHSCAFCVERSARGFCAVAFRVSLSGETLEWVANWRRLSRGVCRVCERKCMQMSAFMSERRDAGMNVYAWTYATKACNQIDKPPSFPYHTHIETTWQRLTFSAAR